MMKNAPPPITIRAAAPADARVLGRLAALLVRTHHDLDPKRFIAPTANTERGYASYLVTQMQKDDVIVLVAELEGAVVGYTYAGIEGWDYMALRGPAGALYDIVVDPDYRHHGIGRTLLEHAVSELEGRGAPRIVLSTAEGNTTAQSLFTKAGFRRTMIEMTRERTGEQDDHGGQAEGAHS
jgi:ribosomal protein S18 acetylase RimI-like enzyme